MEREQIAQELLEASRIIAAAGQLRLSTDEPARAFANTFGDGAQAILQTVGYGMDDITHFSEGTPFVLRVGDSEWHGFDSDDVALKSLKNGLNNHPEYFDVNILNKHIDEKKSEEFFRPFYRGHAVEWVADLPGAVSKHGYENGLVDALVNAGLLKSTDALDTDGKNLMDMYIDFIVNERINEGEGGLSYCRFTYGDDDADDLLVKHKMFNVDSAAQSLLGKAIVINGSSWFRMS